MLLEQLFYFITVGSGIPPPFIEVEEFLLNFVKNLKGDLI